jgi:DNA polymerase-3 subunit alpha
MEFVHLHVHTQYSFLVSTVKVGALAARSQELGMRGVAITDHANMFGAVRHYNACKKAGITPILGCELNVARDDGRGAVDHLVLLAASKDGYKNLIRLVSEGYTRPALDSTPSIRLDQIEGRAGGLIALTGCLGGVAAQRVMEYGAEQGDAILGRLSEMFDKGSLFVELQDHGLPEQVVVNDILVQAARRLDLPIVATNDVHFLGKDDGQAQLYLDCVRQGKTYAEAAPVHHGSFEMYLKSPQEMAQAFSAYPDAIKSTLAVTEMCSGLDLGLGQVMLPHFPVPEGYDTESYFRYVAEEGLVARFEASAERGGASTRPPTARA